MGPTLGFVAVASLPLFRLAHQSLWYDELFSIWVARHSVFEIVHEAGVDGFTPPLYYLLLHVLWQVGIHSEYLRVLSTAGGVVFLFFLTRIATQLGGPRVGLVACVMAGVSPFMIGLSQELRPYTMFMACAAAATSLLLNWRAAPTWRRAVTWGLLIVLGTAFSYLGIALLPLALAAAVWSRARKQGMLVGAIVSVIAIAISIPGFHKAFELAEVRHTSAGIRFDTPPVTTSLARLTFGEGVHVPPLASRRDDRLRAISEGLAAASLMLAIAHAWRRRIQPLTGALAILAAALGALWIVDAITGIGFTTRYMALAFPSFIVVLALTAGISTASRGLVAALFVLQLFGLWQYTFNPTYFRDDWRGLCARLRNVSREGWIVWGFPVHHLQVATDFYGPSVQIDGGAVGRRGDVAYWLPDGQRWQGYGTALRPGDRLAADVTRRKHTRAVLLVTYADNAWHGNTLPLLASFSSPPLWTDRFPARETLVLTAFGAE
jgi:hypothetical protein